ncbi:methyltransferase domain-containing protein [bacterium]|nr:methyltransferase domain-containing protein [bacterium]
MLRKFLPLLVDPVTKKPLLLEERSSDGDDVLEGFLVSETARYPITRGIPRFVSDEGYSGNFGYQWKKWSRVQFESENIGKPLEGHTRKMWHMVTERERDESLRGQYVLDLGCGPGRFIEIAREKGATVVGIDYSEAIDAAAESFRGDPEVLLCQADALNLPFAEGTFHGVFSIGVLHHTPSPKGGIAESFRVLRPGGWLGACVYRKGSYYDFLPVQLWRRFFQFLAPMFGHTPPYLYSKFTTTFLRPIAQRFSLLGKAIRVFLPFANLPDKEWSLLDTFDSVTPSYQSAHISEEVQGWFSLTGFEQIQQSRWSPTAYHGEKPASHAELVANQ